jgi:exopolysaccharide biosynthesis protein
MKTKKTLTILIGLFLAIGLCFTGYLLYDRGRPAPVPMKKTLHEGVVYRRLVRFTPRPMIAHIIIIDRSSSNAKFLVTPSNLKGDYPLKARTTSQFLKDYELQIAINGDGFIPWWSRSPLDYYPHVDDPVMPLGFTASKGKIYSYGQPETPGVEPTLYISRQHYPSFNIRPENIWFAISGDRMLIDRGEIEDGLDDSELDPRTAIGINQNGRYVYLAVVDGRQPFYSDGATFLELAELLKKQGAYFAMALDGGGSSTMVIEGENGEPLILNSPIDNYIPGRERPVANHLGVFIP